MLSLHLPTDALRIVCLGAHPDDVEIGCGGTLLSLADARDVHAVVVVATGSEGRYQETRKALSRFLPGADIDFQFIGLRDGYLPSQWAAIKEALEQVASATSADLVFAPRSDDAHQDHRLLAELALTVWRDALILQYEIPKWDGDLGRANHYVALDHARAHGKVDLLNDCFPSQLDRDWWDREAFLSMMRLRGVECRARYAEAFVVTKALLSLTRDRGDDW